MAITLTRLGTVIELPADLVWTDRDSWSPIVQRIDNSITGALIIDSGIKLAGRPITLEGSESHAWMSFALIGQIKSWAAVPDAQMVLVIGGTAFTVVFRHIDAPAVDVHPVVDYAAPDAADFFFGTLKFMEI